MVTNSLTSLAAEFGMDVTALFKSAVPTCPLCGADLDLVTNGTIAEPMLTGYMVKGRPLPVRERPAMFVACQGCEFAEEIR